jgi:hypothetical protein
MMEVLPFVERKAGLSREKFRSGMVEEEIADVAAGHAEALA